MDGTPGCLVPFSGVWQVHGSTAASQQLGVINSDEAMELSMRHKDTVAVHFKTVLFYHFYHQDAIEWIEQQLGWKGFRADSR
jgi:hypothetical protein